MEPVTIDEFGPLSVVQPQSVAELREIVLNAASKGEAIYPLGGRTMLDYGLPPTRPGTAVDLRSLNQVIDYPARDMTITVQAGITVAQLQKILGAERQRLPIDVPFADRATLGGAVACNVSGPRRYGFGTLRDYVIGISVVNAEGNEVKAGGRVVKNVAGYDLCKLYTGSLGTLGIITQLTFKVRPIPEQHALVGLTCSAADLEGLVTKVHESRTRPTCMEALSPQAAADVLRESSYSSLITHHSSHWLVIVGFEDNQETVHWQVQRLKQELSAGPVRHWLEWAGPEADSIWASLTDYLLSPLAKLSFKANLLPNRIAEFCRLAEPIVPRLQVHAGNGVVIGHFPEDWSQEEALADVNRLRAKAIEAQSNLVLLRCPAEWKTKLGVWGAPRGDWPLMRKIKDQLDPKHLFNPGRFVGGI